MGAVFGAAASSCTHTRTAVGGGTKHTKLPQPRSDPIHCALCELHGAWPKSASGATLLMWARCSVKRAVEREWCIARSDGVFVDLRLRASLGPGQKKTIGEAKPCGASEAELASGGTSGGSRPQVSPEEAPRSAPSWAACPAGAGPVGPSRSQKMAPVAQGLV